MNEMKVVKAQPHIHWHASEHREEHGVTLPTL